MNIGLHDSDKTRFPNLALMKLSAYHKGLGDTVSFFSSFERYDKIYSSKVFTFTSQDPFLYGNSIEKGGTGYDLISVLPDRIEHVCPDYSLYGINYSMGFLTRGCIRNCSFCVVQKKEGAIREHADIEEFLRHKSVILLDNNVLAHSHGLSQIQKIEKLGVKIDFNQGLDSRLIDMQIAKTISRLKWIRFIRTACDNKSQIPAVKKAIENLAKCGVKPYRIFCYLLVDDIDDAYERTEILRELGVDIFAQPYRDIESNKDPSYKQKEFARWVNHKAIFKSTRWHDYKKKYDNLPELKAAGQLVF
ncbi:hypothetical protein A3K80_09140 [Candidatus Bathyarchaeota archaeon RBG_13_38_9]|nr:MAG: hypothetical protein A3K80_09140 [Candidatus Bathyarchaeota archaeon RBG_13_38_9]